MAVTVNNMLRLLSCTARVLFFTAFCLHINLLPAVRRYVDLLRVVDRHRHLLPPQVSHLPKDSQKHSIESIGHLRGLL